MPIYGCRFPFSVTVTSQIAPSKHQQLPSSRNTKRRTPRRWNLSKDRHQQQHHFRTVPSIYEAMWFIVVVGVIAGCCIDPIAYLHTKITAIFTLFSRLLFSHNGNKQQKISPGKNRWKLSLKAPRSSFSSLPWAWDLICCRAAIALFIGHPTGTDSRQYWHSFFCSWLCIAYQLEVRKLAEMLFAF